MVRLALLAAQCASLSDELSSAGRVDFSAQHANAREHRRPAMFRRPSKRVCIKCLVMPVFGAVSRSSVAIRESERGAIAPEYCSTNRKNRGCIGWN